MIGPGFRDVLAGATAGSESAVAALWRDLHLPLLRYLRALEPAAAEDVESETWLAAAGALDRFEGGEREFRAWMFTIARRRLVDWRRRAACRPTSAAGVDVLAATPGGEDPEADALDAVGTEAALRLIATLPPEQAEVVLLRVVAGLDTARVAEVLGRTPGAVRVLQHRALRRLAALATPEALRRRGVTR